MRRATALVLTAGVVALALTVGAAVLAGRWVARDVELDRGVTAVPTAAEIASAVAFCALPGVPPGVSVGPLRREQGIDGLVVFRASGGGAAVAWLAAGGMPGPTPSSGPAGLEFGPDLPSGTPVVEQQRVGRPGGGIVFRSAVLGPDAVEVRCFET
ncbi:hypothetical protein [Actinomycetospora termitidis]|uniref:Uncharacterized protein n=1 Tax=Actinomycetospora termitidis TaxID=3053470 RepID=A0ABT7M814_9PSEU|nr:hypothetical protein [Actinomycetospora sp. Odt1-22]MDL5155942.1 hypothetical protein [Actinomycetospora sp. Odt1-22]